MCFDTLGDLNWLAVIVAAIAYFALGAIWFAPPVFGKAWIASSGAATPQEGQRPSATFYVVPLLTCFVSTVATAMIAISSGTDTVAEGIMLGLVVGIGFAAALAVLGGVFETMKPRAMTAATISAGYHLVGLVIASVILAVWD